MQNDNFILMRVDPFIWQNPDMNLYEKLILNLIFGFTNQNKCCELTNEWIANKFGFEVKLVDDVITLLYRRGIINLYDATLTYPRKMSVNLPDQQCPCLNYFEAEFIEV